MSAKNPGQTEPGEDELDPRLAAIVGAILDGAAVDWTSCTDGVSGSFRDELRILAGIAGVHRSLVSEERRAETAPFPPQLPWQAGPLTITESLGKGAFGEVFRAWDTQLRRDVALKLLFRDRGDDEDDADRFLEEGRLLAKVHHPNVVVVHGAERIEGRVGLITEFVDGRTLAEVVCDRGPLSPTEVLSIGLDLCRALRAVHEAGLLHRDIKPQNVMRDFDGRIVLMDFGAGHQGEATAQAFAGTPLYLAPEIIEGSPATVQSDIYSLGVVLYHLATGRHPVTGGSLAEIQRAHATSRRTPLAEARPDLPKRLVAVLERAIDADPQRRYASAAEMALALSVGGGPRTRLRRAVALGIGLLIAAGGTWASWHSPAPPGGNVGFQPRDWVLVAQFDNDTGEAQFERTLQYAIAHELSNSTYVNVVPSQRVADALRLMSRPDTTVVDATVGREVAIRDGGIRIVVAGRVEKLAGAYVLTAQILDPATGALLGSRRQEARTDAEVRQGVRTVANWIRQQLGESSLRIQETAKQLEKVTTPSLQALALYSESYEAGGRGRWAEAAELVRAALDQDPEFASAHIWLAWSLLNSGQSADEYLPHAHRAFELAAHTVERERYFIRGSYFTLTGDPERAVPAYEALVRLQPDHAWALGNLRSAVSGLGRPREEVALLATRMAAARPNAFDLQAQAAEEMVATRSVDAARPYVERARALLSTVQPGRPGWPYPAWVTLFPVHELWTERRFPEAANALEALGWPPDFDSHGDWALSLRGTLHLTLGQNARGAESFRRIQNPNQRALVLALHALAREDFPAVVAHLRLYAGPDLAAVSLLVRARDFAAARQLFARMSRTSHAEWSAAELEIAATGAMERREVLATSVRTLRESMGVRAFFYSETLAEALEEAGDLPGAIEVFEGTGVLRERLYSTSGANGYLWMRTQKRLANLYRVTGRIDEAKTVEADLRHHLSAADPDHPLLIALQKLDR